MFKTVLVPVDGSATCDCIFEKIRSFGQVYGSKFILLNVYGLPTLAEYNNYPSYPVENAFDAESHSKQVLARVLEKLGPVDFEVETLSEAGNPAGVILDVADQKEVDLILMCTHGMSAMKRFMLGSVTNKVVHHAKQPVLVMR